jgi:hypothetical protein
VAIQIAAEGFPMQSNAEDNRKVQTNLKLVASVANTLDVTSAIEGKDKARIVEEALQLRAALMGAEHQELVQAALRVRFSDNPDERLQAIEALRDDVPGATPGGSVSVAAVLERLKAGALQPA